MMHGWRMAGGWFWVVALVRWVFLAAIVGGVVWFASGRRRSGNDESLAILKRRLAAGEISEADYARLKELLK